MWTVGQEMSKESILVPKKEGVDPRGTRIRDYELRLVITNFKFSSSRHVQRLRYSTYSLLPASLNLQRLFLRPSNLEMISAVATETVMLKTRGIIQNRTSQSQ
jgi:hypothetical protein